MYKKILKSGLLDTGFIFIGSTGTRFLYVILIYVVSFYGTASDIVAYDLLLVVSILITTLVLCGLDSGLAVLSAQQNADLKARYYTLGLGAMLCVAPVLGLVLGLANYFSRWLPDGYLDIFLIMLTFGYLNALYNYAFSYLKWIGEFRLCAVLIFVIHIFGLAGCAYLFIVTGDLPAMFYGIVAINVASALAALWCTSGWIRHGLQVIQAHTALGDLGKLFGVSVPYLLASFLTTSRRSLDRLFILAIGGEALLAVYALIVRTAELIGFAFSLPSLAFGPTIVRNYRSDVYQKLARVGYMAYTVSAPLILIPGYFLWVYLEPSLLPQQDVTATYAFIFLVMLYSYLILNEPLYGGYGFPISANTWPITYVSLGFLVTYGFLGFISAVIYLSFAYFAVSVLIATILYAGLYIWCSEKMHSFGFNQRLTLAVRVGTLSVMIALIGIDGVEIMNW